MVKEEVSPIAEWYAGQSAFITGGTGFMGKVLVEKLLYSCSKIKCLYLLMRTKRGRSPQQRIEDMWKLPVFERLRTSQPEAFNKIIPLTGDLDTENLGLKPEDLNLLRNNVTLVFHIGATLKLEANLKDAIEQNTTGTARVIDVSKQIKNLKAFIYYSTAFCSADVEEFEERVYPCADDPRKVMEVVEWIKPEALEVATKTLIKPHPNTYTYSKRLAETLVANEADNMRVCIIRPSIVCPAWSEPVPGWVDSLNGPMGLLVGAGKGVIRSMHCKGENNAHVIPVDMAICATIIVTQRLGAAKDKPKEVPVYNLTQDGVIKVTWKDVLDWGREIAYDYPFDGQLWYPDGDMRSSKILHNIYCLLLHWLPAIFIDTLLFILRQKTFMIRLQKKIHNGLELLQFFTTRQWVFKSERFLGLSKDMTPADLKLFPMDFYAMPIREYLLLCILGARQYCMKEPLSSLPRARVQQWIMYILHKLFLYTLYIWLFYYIASKSTVAKDFLDGTIESVLSFVHFSSGN